MKEVRTGRGGRDGHGGLGLGLDETEEEVNGLDSQEESLDGSLDGSSDSSDSSASWEGLSDSTLASRLSLSRESSIEPGYSSDSTTSLHENTIGNVPQSWYDDLPHIGYTVGGKKVLRPATRDALDRFLQTEEEAGDDGLGGIKSIMGKEGEVKLSPEELDLIKRLTGSTLERGLRTEEGDYDPYTPTVEFFTAPDLQEKMPLRAVPEPKSRFVRSKWEHEKIMKLVRGIRAGRIMPSRPKSDERGQEDRPVVYDIWADGLTPAQEARMNHPMRIAAPKLQLPGHQESYNPPQEYLLTPSEEEAWRAQEKEERARDHLPKKYDSLRKVPGYPELVRERFERCLDLYLAPRVRRNRLVVDDPASLLPQLPSPSSLRPFPTFCSVVYPHSAMVRTLAIDPSGMWLCTGADDGIVRLWELNTGRCERSWTIKTETEADGEDVIHQIAWTPNPDHFFFVVSKGNEVQCICPRGLSTPEQESATLEWLKCTPNKGDHAHWKRMDGDEGPLVRIVMVKLAAKPVKAITFHRRGDYFATVAPEAGHQALLIHQLSKSASQMPFAKLKGQIQVVEFHPLQPHLFVATRQKIRQYNLQTLSVVRTLTTGLRWISSISVHRSGDHVLAASYDKKLAWFDLDLSAKPFKTLRYHTKAIRAVHFHPRLPLFLSASDDTNLNIFHGKVSNDLTTNPVLVPLKVLKGHTTRDHLGLLAAAWHPRLPWCITSGADGQARLWVA